jgi:hypothetical protein
LALTVLDIKEFQVIKRLSHAVGQKLVFLLILLNLLIVPLPLLLYLPLNLPLLLDLPYFLVKFFSTIVVGKKFFVHLKKLAFKALFMVFRNVSLGLRWLVFVEIGLELEVCGG